MFPMTIRYRERRVYDLSEPGYAISIHLETCYLPDDKKIYSVVAKYSSPSGFVTTNPETLYNDRAAAQDAVYNMMNLFSDGVEEYKNAKSSRPVY